METRPPVGDATPDAITRAISSQVEALAPVLLHLSHRIHANPELGHEERQASAWCAELLSEHGFEVTAPFGGLETAFRARAVVGRPRPAIAFLAEYDALPGMGHACGHNIIGASAVGAGIALARTLENLGITATVLVDGTPAEETRGGKIPLVEQGFYRDVDVALAMHPYSGSSAGSSCLGVKRMTFSFHGRAAHAAAEPHKGVNALDAVIQTFNNINALRQHVKPDVRIHGIITQGGQASNIVPDFAEAVFSARSADMTYFAEVVGKVIACARGAALATGATLDIEENQTYGRRRRRRPGRGQGGLRLPLGGRRWAVANQASYLWGGFLFSKPGPGRYQRSESLPQDALPGLPFREDEGSHAESGPQRRLSVFRRG